jgi:Arc/MetJ family transcription regulator
MTITSIDIDQDELKQAKELTGTSSNRETVDLALRTLIAVRRQPAAVERIISRHFEPDQIDAPTIAPPAYVQGATTTDSTASVQDTTIDSAHLVQHMWLPEVHPA